MLHTSYIELSRGALKNNLDYIRRKVGPNVRYSMVVKANAYGHGIEQILPLAEEFGVDHFAVFSLAEALKVQEIKREGTDLMVMGWLDHDHIAWAIEHGVSFYVFTEERLLDALRTARKIGRPARIHLEVETGMHRTGFRREELSEVIELIRGNRDVLAVEGICTHYAGAESVSNYDRIIAQIGTFNRLSAWINAEGIFPRYQHTACSAAVFNFPESIMDMVRVGIANYGYWPSSQTKLRHLFDNGASPDPLQRVLSWKSKVMSLNQVEEGEYISYGDTYLTNRKTRIATVPVGYGYGYNRTLSNNGHVLLRGRRIPVIGLVNMNMMVIDVTDLEGVAVGDEVVLIGNQGDRIITVSSFGDMNNSMNYEMLTRLPDHIPRIVVD